MTKEVAIDNLMADIKYWENTSVSTEHLYMAIKALEQEPKTGHWVKKSQYGNDYCSECDYELLMRGKPKFCPNCGTKMESEG